MARDAFAEWALRFGHGRAGVLARLRTVVKQRQRIRPGDVQAVADETARPVAAVAGAAGFYADFAGVRAQRHVRVCEGTSCFVSADDHGRPLTEATLGIESGCTNAGGSISASGAYCLGYCYASPAALDGRVAVTGPNLGQRLRNDQQPAEPAPPIPYRNASRQAVTLAGLTTAAGPWEVWPEVVTRHSRAEVLAEVAQAGLRGRGGAEFPAADKWRAASAHPPPRVVVANGDEGDPGSFCDRLLMERDPNRVLEGLALAGFAAGANRGVVFVRSEYPIAAEKMRSAVDIARAAGHLGTRVHGSAFDFDVEVVEGAGSYVAGEETALLHALEGLRGSVRPRPPYPTDAGLAGQPTVVNNVETLAAVPWIVRHGGTAYSRLGTPAEPGTKLVCLSQRFRYPGVVEVEFGMPLRHIVDTLGGGLKPDHALRAVQVGGPLGGFLGLDDLNIPFLAGTLAETGVALGHGSLVAIDDGVPPLELLRHVWRFAAAESCGACTPCRVGSRRGLEWVTDTWRETEETLSQQEKLLNVMAVGSMCAFGRGVPKAVRSLVRVYREELLMGGS